MKYFRCYLNLTQIQEYTRKKNEREIAFEQELRKQKLLKEKSIAKIQASQQATYDLQAAKDELNALRVRDQVQACSIAKDDSQYSLIIYMSGQNVVVLKTRC